MSTSPLPTSAKIYQFPVKAANGHIATHPRGKSSFARRPQPFPIVEFGSGWYHEAAIQAETPRK